MKKVLLFTDGACSGNPGPGGWAAILALPDFSRSKIMSGGFRLTTNNRMELLAAINGLGNLTQPCEVNVFSDSQYLCNAFAKGWIDGWVKKGWTRQGKPVPNKDLWLRLLELRAIHKCLFIWVRGHAGHVENERCDALARGALQRNDLPPDLVYEASLRN